MFAINSQLFGIGIIVRTCTMKRIDLIELASKQYKQSAYYQPDIKNNDEPDFSFHATFLCTYAHKICMLYVRKTFCSVPLIVYKYIHSSTNCFLFILYTVSITMYLPNLFIFISFLVPMVKLGASSVVL